LKRIFLGLAIHNHQPLGNFPWVFEDAYRRGYLPMLEALGRHPSISVSLHYSGCLLDWLSDEHPEFFKLLSKLISREQVEMMGGGYYEPILPMIPDADKAGQVGRMSEYIWQQFGRRPRGLWLAERVWEPSLAMPLADAGIDWTLVDDTGFKMVGRDDRDLFGYFKTEEQGKYLKVFPISKYLRYAIPWHKVEDVIAYLRENASESGDKIAVLGDDGEKFGIWPQTYDLCWEEKWVERFFTAIEENAEWLTTIKLGDYAQRYPAAGRVYLPCASYDEMLEWSLPAELSAQYKELKLRVSKGEHAVVLGHMFSGFWRNFLVKYPEINRMQKKMLAVSARVHRAHAINEAGCGVEHLWKAQCNCPYWHGVFGGIYLTDIRATTFTNLIKAENCADAALQLDGPGYRWQQVDFDGDGAEEIIIEGKDLNLYISPVEGGSIFEWDLRGHAFNVLSSVSRKPEAYHMELAAGEKSTQEQGDGVHSIHDGVKIKDRDVADWLIYDTLPRSSLSDRFFHGGVAMDDYRKNAFEEVGDFAGRPYNCRVVCGDDALQVNMEREGTLLSAHGPCNLILEKSVSLARNDGSLYVGYRFVNAGDKYIDAIFAGEWNINLLGGGHNEAAYYHVEGRDIGDVHLDSGGEITGIARLSVGNRHLGIELDLELDRPLTVWRYPVESVSNSEGGLEKIYQCSCVVILLPLNLEPGQAASLSYNWRVVK